MNNGVINTKNETFWRQNAGGAYRLVSDLNNGISRWVKFFITVNMIR